MYESPFMIRTDARGPRGPAETESLRPRRPNDGPDFESPTHIPLPRDLRREKRKGIGLVVQAPVLKTGRETSLASMGAIGISR